MQIITDISLTASRIDKKVPIPFLKRAFDVVGSLLFIILFSPIIFLVFVAMKIEGVFSKNSRGPFLYSETRISQGKSFCFYKLRIFKIGVLKEMLNKNGFIHTKPLERNPKNLTRVGNFLKKFYLDEFSQLFNVLKGDMSFVGPRPWNVIDYEKDMKRKNYRKKVLKAGITGLVQITKEGRSQYPGGDSGLDDYYLRFSRERSVFSILLFDFYIMSRSIIMLLRGKGL